jgi:hypothetical protein
VNANLKTHRGLISESVSGLDEILVECKFEDPSMHCKIEKPMPMVMG